MNHNYKNSICVLMRFRVVWGVRRALFISLLGASANIMADCIPITAVAQSVMPIVYCTDEQDGSEVLQKAIDNVHSSGGGYVEFGIGPYNIKKSIRLRDGVSIIGAVGKTHIILHEQAIAFTQDENESLNGITVANLYLISTSKSVVKAFSLKGHENSNFENLSFSGFENATIFDIRPASKKKPAQNAVFNHYSNIYSDGCNVCVVYHGQKYSVISNNVWRNIVFRKVYKSAIEAQQWVDSEKWYNLYAQAFDDDVILINLNTSNDEWEQVDRFHFYSPTLVYSPTIHKTNSIHAIRFGKGTFKHFMFGVISDKTWEKFVVDDGARSFYILKGSSGMGFKENPGIISKGFSK